MKKRAVISPARDAGATAAAAASVENDLLGGIREPRNSLPRDHPAWQRDVLSISARARAIVARLRPVAVRVLTFWDHVRRGVTIAGRTLEIDPSGSYRLR